MPPSGLRLDRTKRFRLSAEERDVLHAVDGTSTVQDIVDRSPLSEFDVYHILYELLNRSLIEEARVAADPGGSTAAAARSRVLNVTLSLAVGAMGALGIATLGRNPLTPWRLAPVQAENDLLKSYASRARVDALDHALRCTTWTWARCRTAWTHS